MFVVGFGDGHQRRITNLSNCDRIDLDSDEVTGAWEVVAFFGLKPVLLFSDPDFETAFRVFKEIWERLGAVSIGEGG